MCQSLSDSRGTALSERTALALLPAWLRWPTRLSKGRPGLIRSIYPTNGAQFIVWEICGRKICSRIWLKWQSGRQILRFEKAERKCSLPRGCNLWAVLKECRKIRTRASKISAKGIQMSFLLHGNAAKAPPLKKLTWIWQPLITETLRKYELPTHSRFFCKPSS